MHPTQNDLPETTRIADQAQEARDAATADLLTEISRGVDKYLWLFESHNQSHQRRADS